MNKERHKPKKWAVKKEHLSTRANQVRWKTPEGFEEWHYRRFCFWDGYPPTHILLKEKAAVKEMYDDVDSPL